MRRSKRLKIINIGKFNYNHFNVFVTSKNSDHSEMIPEKGYVKSIEKGYSTKQNQVGKMEPGLALALKALKMTLAGKALIDFKDSVSLSSKVKVPS